jgi:hypothetical protein
MSEPQRRPLRSEDGAGFGQVVHVVVDGERGTIQLFAVVLDYPLDGSGIRQAQVKQLASFVSDVAPKRDLVVCGDFNAGPDSDEIRMLTGRSAPASPGLVFYDSWELAGDGSPGYTWSNSNPLAAIGLYGVLNYSVIQQRREISEQMSEIVDDEIKAYLLHLLRVKQLAVSSIIVAVSALRFFFGQVLHRPTEAIEKALPSMKKPILRPRLYSVPELVQLFHRILKVRQARKIFDNLLEFFPGVLKTLRLHI